MDSKFVPSKHNVGDDSKKSYSPIPKPISVYAKTLQGGAITSSKTVPQEAVKPKNKKKFFLSLGIVLLVLLLISSIVLALVLPQSTRPSDIDIDFFVNSHIELVDINAGGSAEDIENIKVLPGDTLKCSFEIASQAKTENTSQNLDVFLRIKTSAICENNYFSNFATFNFGASEEWFKGADGFYYYQKTSNSTGLLSVGQKIDIAQSLQISKSVGNELAGKTVKIQFVAEVLQAQYQAIFEIWPTAPVEWSSQYKNLTW